MKAFASTTTWPRPAARILASSLTAICLLTACGPSRRPATEHSLTVEGLDANVWTYISLENATVVGTSPLGDAREDSLWHDRIDWDIAVAGDLIRTNSGSSGLGHGGLQIVNEGNYRQLTTAPETGYVTDVDNVPIKR